MALPHPLYVTGAGTDPDELFYGCNVGDVDGPPGSGSRGLSPGEDALSINFNRIGYALAKNDEYLYSIFEQEVPAVEIASLSSFSGSSITLNPTGSGGSNINFTGKVYLGDGTIPSGQEGYDTIFKILDANYHEVLVSSTEVKVTVSSPVLGSGFYNGGVVTLTLGAALPSGNYRLAYCRGYTKETLPAGSMIRGAIRGLENYSAEAKEVLTRMRAYSEIGMLTSFNDDEITIDPTNGGSSDINFDGDIYLGDSSYVGQEGYNSLFQFLDEDYNEVIDVSSNKEIIVTGISPASLGDEFYNTGVLTLALGTESGALAAPVPSGNYRLIYSRGYSLTDMPDDAFIRTTIRSAEEIEAKTQIQIDGLDGRLDTAEGDIDDLETALPKTVTFTTCAASGTSADYNGATAIYQALNADKKYIYVRAGTYDAVLITKSNVTIIGESRDSVIIKGLKLTGNYNVIRNVCIEDDSTPSYESFVGPYGKIENCLIKKCILVQANCTLDNCYFNSPIRSNPYNYYLKTYASDVTNVSIKKCRFSSLTPENSILRIAHVRCGYIYFEESSLSTSNSYGILRIDENFEKIVFNDCSLNGLFSSAYYTIASTNTGELIFNDCHLTSNYGVINTDNLCVNFLNCKIVNNGTAEYNIPFIKIGEVDATLNNSSIINCRFTDSYCVAPLIGMSRVPVVGIDTANIENVSFVLTNNKNSNYEENSFIRLEDCIANNLFLDFSGNSLDASPGSDGNYCNFIQSNITNVSVILPVDPQTHQFIRLRGSKLSNVTFSPILAPVSFDEFIYMLNYSTDADYNCELSGLNITSDLFLTATDCLIHTEGSNININNNYIYIRSDALGPINLIYISPEATHDGRNIQICNNYIKSEKTNSKRIIFIVEYGSSVIIDSLISDNYIYSAQTMSHNIEDPVAVINTGVYYDLSVEDHKRIRIVNNYLRAVTVASTGMYLILLCVNDDSGVNPGGNCSVYGNTLEGTAVAAEAYLHGNHRSLFGLTVVNSLNMRY
jgi:hypothetical protein